MAKNELLVLNLIYIYIYRITIYFSFIIIHFNRFSFLSNHSQISFHFRSSFLPSWTNLLVPALPISNLASLAAVKSLSTAMKTSLILLRAIAATIEIITNLIFCRHAKQSEWTFTIIKTKSKLHNELTNSIVYSSTTYIKPTSQDKATERTNVRRESAIHFALDLV